MPPTPLNDCSSVIMTDCCTTQAKSVYLPRYDALIGFSVVHQYSCPDCQHWRAKPTNPKMADLPPAHLRLHKPAFYSSGIDCFGPFMVKIGRRTKKLWGIIFKCMTTRANFKGGERELKNAFTVMAHDLQKQLACQKITFRFNPQAARHFGGLWEREIHSVKSALYTILGAWSVPKEVVQTVLLEVQLILNSKLLRYISSDMANPDPITPNILLMGGRGIWIPAPSGLPEIEPLRWRRWRRAQVLADHFWAHFIHNYLPRLEIRQKWT